MVEVIRTILQCSLLYNDTRSIFGWHLKNDAAFGIPPFESRLLQRKLLFSLHPMFAVVDVFYLNFGNNCYYTTSYSCCQLAKVFFNCGILLVKNMFKNVAGLQQGMGHLLSFAQMCIRKLLVHLLMWLPRRYHLAYQGIVDTATGHGEVKHELLPVLLSEVGMTPQHE